MVFWIRDEATAAGFDGKSLKKIELASEEAIVNVIHHSYHDLGGEIQIVIDAMTGQQIQITLSDSGEPFNPLGQKERPAKKTPLREIEEGGIGLLLIRQCMDEVRYQRSHDNQNVLTLVKRK